MKTLCLFVTAVAIAVLWTGACYALSELGSPLPQAPRGGFAGGVGYANYTSTWEFDGGENDGDEVPGDIKQNYIFVQGSYGFLPGWEAYGRVGMANATIGEVPGIFDEKVKFEGDYKVYFGAGMRGLIYGTETFQVGPFFQYNKYSTYEKDLEGSINTSPVTVPVDFADAYDVNFGLAGDYPIGAAGLLYGGVLAYWAKGTGTFSLPEAYGGTMSQDFNEKGVVGGLLGLRLPLGSGLNLNFEGDYKSGMTFSVSINKAFGMK
jgi:hypothetical protein